MNKEDYSKYYIQGSDHYLISKDVFDELFDEMENWKEEAKELKAELQLYKGALNREHEAIHRANELEKVINEAIKLIEDSYYSKNTTDIDSIVLSSDKLIKVRRILKEVE